MADDFNVFDFTLSNDDLGEIALLDTTTTTTTSFFDHQDPAMVQRLSRMQRSV
jgi:2,5-diketo-D-gluconate reductase A